MARILNIAHGVDRQPRGFILARSSIAAILFGLLAISPGVSASPATGSGTVYTADEIGGSISIIDVGSGQVETIPVPIMPHNIQISANGNQLYVVGMGMPDMQMQSGTNQKTSGGQLLILDSARVADGPVAAIPIGPHPAHVVTNAGDSLAFVTDSEENAVLVIDLANRTIMRKIGTGAYPHGLRMSPDGGELYVANVKDGSVSVIDTASFTESARIKLGKKPVQVGFTPDGAKVFVSLNGENKVAIIDRQSRQVIGKVAVGRNPVQVYATPDGRFVYVANQGSDQNPDDKVSVIDVASRAVIATITTGKGAHGIVVSTDGKAAFITNIKDGTVSSLDTATQTVSSSFKVGDGPNGITFLGSEE